MAKASAPPPGVSPEDAVVLAELSAAAGRTKERKISLGVSVVPAAVAKAATRMFCKWVMCNPGSLSSYACQDPLLTQFFATLGMTNGVTRYQLDKCLDEFYEEYKTELAGMLKNQHFSLSADAWTSKHVNLGYKLIGACINTTNASTLLDFTATSGEKQDAEFILETFSFIEKAKKMVAISMHERMKRKRAEADPDEMDYLLDCMLDD